MALEGAQGAGGVSLVPSMWLVPTPLGANNKQRMFICCLQAWWQWQQFMPGGGYCMKLGVNPVHTTSLKFEVDLRFGDVKMPLAVCRVMAV